MELKLYAADVRVLEADELLEMAMNRIAPDRREKAERIKPLPEKRRSVAAGLLLQQGLLMAGIPVEKQRFTVKENRKPCLIGNGTVCFNLSHSGNVVLLAVSFEEVGCDVQEKKQIDLRIAQRFFHPLEAEKVRSETDPVRQNEWMNWIWSRKESVVKTSGRGLTEDMTAFSVLDDQVQQGPYYLRDVAVGENYTASVCSVQEILPEEKVLTPKWVDLRMLTEQKRL